MSGTSVVVQYLSRKYCFTAVCSRRDGNYEATLARRSPGLAESRKRGATVPVAEIETFRSTSQVGALLACRRRVLELGGEILSEISAEQND